MVEFFEIGIIDLSLIVIFDPQECVNVKTVSHENLLGPFTSSCSCSNNGSVISSWLGLFLQLCWHSDGCGNGPSLAPNLSHISWENTGSLLAAILHSLLTSYSMNPPWLPATKHWTHKCLQRTLPCLYTLFERLHFSLSVWELRCLCSGLPTVPVCNSTTPNLLSPPSCCRLALLSVLIFVFWPLANTECHFSAITSPHSPDRLKPCPHSISSLHLFAPRCILVIFCVVCFGSSSVSRHGH